YTEVDSRTRTVPLTNAEEGARQKRTRRNAHKTASVSGDHASNVDRTCYEPSIDPVVLGRLCPCRAQIRCDLPPGRTAPGRDVPPPSALYRPHTPLDSTARSLVCTRIDRRCVAGDSTRLMDPSTELSVIKSADHSAHRRLPGPGTELDCVPTQVALGPDTF